MNEYSENSITIYKKLYFNPSLNEKKFEDTHERISKAIATNDEEYKNFRFILDEQIFRPNTPVFINAGCNGKHSHDNQLCACHISDLKDSMDSIIELWSTSAKIFAGGAGVGFNITNLREKKSPLSTSGYASGPVAYLDVLEILAQTIRSGGRCLAPYQKIYTTEGIKEIKQLAENEQEFIILSFDKKHNRIKAKKARAFKSGFKIIYKLITDKGEFHLSKDHPILLKTGEYINVKDLKPNMRLRSCSPKIRPDGYISLSINDGKKTKEMLHRLLVRDILNKNINNLYVHHKDEKKLNNTFDNLEILTNKQHTSIHVLQQIKDGKHIFSNNKFPKIGNKNGMSKEKFWKEKTINNINYKRKQRKILINSGRSRDMQKLASKQKALNTGYKLINMGYDISNLEKYLAARVLECKKLSPKQTKERLLQSFGTYANYYNEICTNNHIVKSITKLKLMPVYDIEVYCNSPNDLSNGDSHNFLITDINSNGFEGSGILVHNSRRSAMLATFDYDHPDVFEILNSKKNKNNLQSFNLSMTTNNYFMSNILINNNLYIEYNSPNPISDYNINKKTFNSLDLWKQMIENAWETGDPGLIFLDHTNKTNPLPSRGYIRAGNPCNEVCLFENSVCCLGSINLKKCIDNEKINYEKLKEYIKYGIIFLDNIIDKTSYIHEKYKKTMMETRPIGLGIMGFADILVKLKIPYDSEEAKIIFTKICKTLTKESIKISIDIAKEKGKIEIPDSDVKHFKNLLKYYGCKQKTIQRFEKYGIRNCTWTSIAPTGSISISADCSYSFEPLSAIIWQKKLAESDTLMNFTNPEFENWLDDYITTLQRYPHGDKLKTKIINKIIENNGSVQGIEEIPKGIQNIFKVAHDIKPYKKIDMQAAGQRYISLGISSTCNLPNYATIEDVDKIFKYAWKQGLKGITVYRNGCKENQPINFGKKDCKEKSKQKIINNKIERPIFRHGGTFEIKTTDGRLFLTLNKDKNENPLEVFLRLGKAGQLENLLLDTIARLISKNLQNRVPYDDISSLLRGIKGDKFWFKLTEQGESIGAESIMDSVGIIMDNYFSPIKGSINDVEELLINTKDQCPMCNKYSIVRDTGCKSGRCINENCMYTSCG